MKLLNSPSIPTWTGVLMLNSGASSVSSGATGTVLRGAGAGVMPTWGAVSLTGDVSGDLPFANIAQIATNRLVGRQASGTGDIEALSLGSNNGVAFDWATAGTLKISTSQDLQTTATPTFSRATLNVATGTAPLTISSTTVCSNLNADLLDGYHATNFAFTQASGTPRMNLGTPLVEEMALFDAEYTNKTERYAIANVWLETSTDNVNWTDATPTDANKRLLIGGDSANSGITVAYGTPYFRIRVRSTSYVYLNAIYAYLSTSGHQTQVQVFKKHDSDANWTQVTSSSTNVSSWPGHLYLPHSTIPFNPSAVQGTHVHEVYALFIPTWNGTYPSNPISLYKFQWWGGYPAGKRNLYTTDEYGSATFPLNIYAAAGSAAAPSIATSGDIDTGLYSYGANQLGIAAGGANVGYFSSSGLTLATALSAGNGGTGLASYTTGDLLYASGATTLAKLAGVATGSVLISGGVSTAPSWGKVDLTTHVSGDLPFANIAQIATNRLVGRQTTGTGDIEALSLGSNNGVAFDWATASTLKISTAQDIQTTATPTFSKLTLNIAIGTAPLTITSTTVCTNLNADLVDGYHAQTATGANTIAVRDASDYITATRFVGNLNGYKLVDNTNEMTIAQGFNYAGTGYLNYRGATQAMQALTICDGMGAGVKIPVKALSFDSSVATGTAPLVVASTTVCTNLNADLHDGMHAPVAGNNGNTWGHVATVKSDGVMEIGRYLDFHHTSNDGVDYAARLYTDGSTNNYLILDGKMKILNGLMIGTQHDLSSRFESGFFSTDTASTAENWPLNASWMHCIAATHADTGTYYSLQLVADYFAQRFFIRSTNNSGATAWNRMLVSAADVTQYGVAYGTTYGTLATATAGSNGQVFLGVTSGAPGFATMSGDATITNAGALTIANNAVTLGKMATMATNRLLGRQAASTGIPEVLSLGSNNGVAFDWGTASTLKISTPQDLQTTASPTFVTVNAFGAASGTSAFVTKVSGDTGNRLKIDNVGACIWDDGAATGYNLMLNSGFDPDTLTLSSANGHAWFATDHLALNSKAPQGTANELTNDATQLALYSNCGTGTGWLRKVVCSQYGTVTVANTVNETTLVHATSKVGSLGFPSNAWALGKNIHIHARGYMSITGSTTFTLRIKNSSGTMMTLTATLSGSITGQDWFLEADSLCTAVGASGNFRTLGDMHISQGSFQNDKELHPSSIPTDLTTNTTTSQTLDVTVQWGTANASNTITITHLIVELLA